jgi:uncharacterized protein (TIGR02594 family)
MARDPLDIIEYAESKGKNVPNYKFGPGFTAQGYYQITNPTWRDHARAAGVDLSRYPTAMAAPKDVQRAVAADIFKKRGFQPWEAVKHLRGQEKDYNIPVAGKREEAPLERINGPKMMPTQTASLSPQAPKTGSLSGAMGRAMAFHGMNETANRDVLGKFMTQNGIPISPQNVAWCAAFVNASLAEQGLPTTGSLMARSFLKWGQETKAPNQGDIAVFSRTGDPNKGHVGFYGGTVDRDGQQYIRVFGGNQGGPAKGGGEAGWTELPASRLLGYRTAGDGTQVASNLAPGAPSPAAAADTSIPTLPKGDPVTGLISQTSDPWAEMMADREKEQQAQQQQQQQAQVAPPPAAPAPVEPTPAAPPVDYSALLMPRLRRGLLADQGYGLLA